MEMKELYETYGKLLVDAEILNSQIAEVKRQIAEKLNASQAAKVAQSSD
jgi:hypothetical protein